MNTQNQSRDFTARQLTNSNLWHYFSNFSPKVSIASKFSLCLNIIDRAVNKNPVIDDTHIPQSIKSQHLRDFMHNADDETYLAVYCIRRLLNYNVQKFTGDDLTLPERIFDPTEVFFKTKDAFYTCETKLTDIAQKDSIIADFIAQWCTIANVPFQYPVPLKPE